MDFDPIVSSSKNTIFANGAKRAIVEKRGLEKLYFHKMPKNKEYPHIV